MRMSLEGDACVLLARVHAHPRVELLRSRLDTGHKALILGVTPFCAIVLIASMDLRIYRSFYKEIWYSFIHTMRDHKHTCLIYSNPSLAINLGRQSTIKTEATMPDISGASPRSLPQIFLRFPLRR